MSKTKNDHLEKPPRSRFIMWWLFIGVLGTLLQFGFQGLNAPLTRDQDLIAQVVLGFIPPLLQVIMIEKLFKRSMRGFLVYSMIGYSIMLVGFLRNWSTNFEVTILAVTLASLVPSLMQTVWLWRRVQKPWLWFATALVIAGVERLIYSRVSYPITPQIASLAFSLAVTLGFSLVYGTIMHYLLSHPKDVEKPKIRAIEDDSASDQARLARLEETDERALPWIEGPAKGAQQEA
jgi:hypothetical protein